MWFQESEISSNARLNVAGIGRPDNLFSDSYTLRDRIGFFRENSMGTDVIFIVGLENNQLRVPAHKLILACSSPVFYSMFFSQMESHNEIVIPDCDPEAFKLFIQLLYTNNYGTSTVGNLVSELLYIARKYLYKPLETHCVMYLREHINSDAVYHIMELADIYMMPELTAICWEYIEENTSSVLETQIDKLSLEKLCLILGNDKLNIKEIDLFQYIIRWAKFTCKILEDKPMSESCKVIAEPAFKLIRYSTMSPKELADHVVPSGVLTQSQIVDIYTYINATNARPQIEFNTKARVWSKGQSLTAHTSEAEAGIFNFRQRQQSRSSRRRLARQDRDRVAGIIRIQNHDQQGQA